MSLSYFTIFNPSLGPDEETLPNQLLFYTSSAVSDLGSQLRNIGLVQGIIELGRSFSSPNATPINFIKSKDTRSYLLELESGFWSILCLDVVAEDGSRDKEIPITNQVLLQVQNAYDTFKLEHGSFETLLKQGRELCLKVTEMWWMRWAWSYAADCADAALLCGGYRQSRTALAAARTDEIESFRSTLRKLYSECFHELLVMWDDDYLNSGVLLGGRQKQILQTYVTEHCRDVHTAAGRQMASDGNDHVGDDKNNDCTGSSHASEESWLSGKKWSKETNRMFGTLLFKKAADEVVSADSPDPDSNQSQYSWSFIEEKKIFLNVVTHETAKEMFLNVLCSGKLSFILILDTPASRERALVREHIDEHISHLAVSLSQSSTSDTPSSTQQATPLFFSIIHDLKTGCMSSTFPSLSSALEDSPSDTPLQLTVKANTIHLHRQTYLLWAQNLPESCTKTSKNIWIMMKRDSLGSVILAKSARNGETMEEVEREGQRWMTRLRKTLHHDVLRADKAGGADPIDPQDSRTTDLEAD